MRLCPCRSARASDALPLWQGAGRPVTAAAQSATGGAVRTNRRGRRPPRPPSRARRARRDQSPSRSAGSSASSRSGRRVGRAAQRLVAPPAGDLRVVAREQHRRAPRARATRAAWCRPALRAARPACDSCTSDSALPMTPGSSRATASTIASTADLAAVEHVVAERDLGDRARASAASSSTRWSMPSYRPQANTSRGLARELLRRGLGERLAARRRDDDTHVGSLVAGASTASSAAPHGSGRITMPAPPPYGVSSTVRCRSSVQSRRSCTCRSIRPRSTRLAEQRQPQRGEVVGEDRDDVDAHGAQLLGVRRAGPLAGRPRRARRRGRPRARSPRRTGTSDLARRRGRRTTSRSWPGRCSTSVTSPSASPSTRHDGAARRAGGRRTRRGPRGARRRSTSATQQDVRAARSARGAVGAPRRSAAAAGRCATCRPRR